MQSNRTSTRRKLLAHLLDLVRRTILSGGEVRDARYCAISILKHVGRLDDGDEVLRMTNLALETWRSSAGCHLVTLIFNAGLYSTLTLPYLSSRQDRRGALGVDGLSIC